MSVFFKNTCHFDNCCKNFYSLSDLITHIENDHLDFDPRKVDQLETEKPDNIHLSYVLKFNGPDEPLPDPPDSSVNEAVIQELDDATGTEVVTAFNNNNNYLGCDFKETKEKKMKSEARLNKEDISQILGNNMLFMLDQSHKKPFACGIKGCEKRYKNVNGIKYHYKNHHKMLIPTLRKSILKHKPSSHSKPKMERRELHGIPLYSYKPTIPNDIVYQNMHRFEEPNEFYYKFNPVPTSDVISSTQVPLANASFNYYNVEANGDIEDFSGKNSNYFLQSFDKF